MTKKNAAKTNVVADAISASFDMLSRRLALNESIQIIVAENDLCVQHISRHTVCDRCFVDLLTIATVAQLVEHRTHKPGVASSILARGTIRHYVPHGELRRFNLS